MTGTLYSIKGERESIHLNYPEVQLHESFFYFVTTTTSSNLRFTSSFLSFPKQPSTLQTTQQQ